jgi:hypothetical protein
MYQSDFDFKCPYSNRPLQPLIGLTQYLSSGTQDRKITSSIELLHEFCC